MDYKGGREDRGLQSRLADTETVGPENVVRQSVNMEDIDGDGGGAGRTVNL